MRIRTVLVSAVLVAVVIALVASSGTVSSQPTPVQPLLRTPPPANSPFAHAPGVPPPSHVPAPMVPVIPAPPLESMVPPPPPQKTVEELLNDLERVQAQKAELAKKEQELKATVRKKLEHQAERLNKLGVAPQAAPSRVGRIIIEGNTNTPDEKILKALVTLRPGQVLQNPPLEAARDKRFLEKAGFQSVEIDVLPNELDTSFVDIRIRVTEPEPKPAAPQPKTIAPK